MLDGLIPRLEAWVQEELGAQRKLLENLKCQERAIVTTDLDSLDQYIQEGRDLRAKSGPRDRRRHMLLKDFERVWSVSAKAMTLGSIVARLGSNGRRLDILRRDLKTTLKEIGGLARRVRTFARYHQSVIHEVVEDVLETNADAISQGGALVNTEA
ncbi:MAG: hypothetical protein ACJAZ8_000100 [Planctomycetota bacterium]|jgi:hypothetical protein